MNGHIHLLCQYHQFSQTLVSRSLRDRNAINCSLACTERLEHRDESIDLIASFIVSDIEHWTRCIIMLRVVSLGVFPMGQPACRSLSLMRSLHRDRCRGGDPMRAAREGC